MIVEYANIDAFFHFVDNRKNFKNTNLLISCINFCINMTVLDLGIGHVSANNHQLRSSLKKNPIKLNQENNNISR